MSAAPGDDPRSGTARVFVRPFGNPLPLGFFSFGIGMVVLAGIGLGLVEPGPQVRTAGILLAAFVFPLEFLAAVMAFLTRDTGAATALGLFATSWLGVGVLHIAAPVQQTSTAVGMFQAAFAVMLLPIAAAGFMGKTLLGLVLTVSALRAALAAAFQLGAPRVLETANAAGALLLFALSVYAGTAFLVEDMRQQTVLPILRRGEARRAIEDELAGQYGRLPLEPGVRRQL